MKITITYCVSWNYLPRASSLAAEISETLGLEAELAKGSGGVFDVKADDAVIFSKHDEGRFPDNVEVIEALQSYK